MLFLSGNRKGLVRIWSEIQVQRKNLFVLLCHKPMVLQGHNGVSDTKKEYPIQYVNPETGVEKYRIVREIKGLMVC